MNLDRIVSVISLLIGLSGIGLSIYLAQPESNANIVSLSGWLASIVVTIVLSVSAFFTIGNLQKEIGSLQQEIVRAKDESIQHKNDLISQQTDLVSYRNISSTLSSIINPEPLKDTIRNKLAAFMGTPQEQKDEQK
ncbi:hypothetical protein [Pseudomonas chlororaphis]|jgi:hypothetical protein|uniref:hypothetical protein n=1 Tax=Pseudomonas chlororaphis TaxID=587753 RepID=UPI0012DA3CB5|nr:hypothetical protein [Pseudomonas chlororaphis]